LIESFENELQPSRRIRSRRRAELLQAIVASARAGRYEVKMPESIVARPAANTRCR